MATAESVLIPAFLFTNSAWVLAYLPQIIAIAGDAGHAKTVSGATRGLFLVSNPTSALYAATVSADLARTVAFAASIACRASIVGLLWRKRRARVASQGVR